MRTIYDSLLSGGPNELEANKLSDPSDTYAITRTWASSFKDYMVKKMKSLKSAPSKKAADAARNDHCGGLDMINLSEVMGDEKKSQAKSNTETTETERDRDPFKGEDPTSKISCGHGKCPIMHNRNQVRLISGAAWKQISKAFPEALAHGYEPKSNDAIGNCKQCLLEKEQGKMLPQKLNEWKESIFDSETLHELLERGEGTKSYPSVINVALNHNSEESITCRVLHDVDLQRWMDALNIVEKMGKKKSDTIRRQLIELLFVSSETSPSGREWRFRSLKCQDHDRATVDIPKECDNGDVRSWLQKLDDSNVKLLLDAEYDEFARSLTDLEAILYREESARHPPEPPTVTLSLQDGRPSMCINPRLCHRGCTVPLFSDECIQDDHIVLKPKQPKRPTNKAEPVEEAPKGPLCKVIVHEVDNGADATVAASSIMLDVSAEKEMLASNNGRPRRSRKARGDGGGGFPVHEIEMALDGNLAHFRLLLHQRDKKLYGQRLFLLRNDASEEVEELFSGSSNLKTMQEIALSTSNADATDNTEDFTIHMILAYESFDNSKPNTRKRVSEEEKQEEETIHYSLLEIQAGGWKTADVNDVSDIAVGGKKTKRRRHERGFQGTFLQSTELSPPQDDGSDALQQSEGEDKRPSPDEESETLQQTKEEDDEVVIIGTPEKIMANNPQQGSSDGGGTSPNNSVATQPPEDDLADGGPLKLADLACSWCSKKPVISICSACKEICFCGECEAKKYKSHYETCSNANNIEGRV